MIGEKYTIHIAMVVAICIIALQAYQLAQVRQTSIRQTEQLLQYQCMYIEDCTK